ncbi:MAG: ABC-type amino acid transport substrate-binding protein [Alteromonadaceae bacterium]
MVSLVDYAPYVFVEGNQSVKGIISIQSSTERVKGYSWDVFKESFFTMGYAIEYAIVPWPRALKLLEYGHAKLLFPISKSDQRLQTFNYSKESTNAIDYVIYSPISTTFQWQGYESLKDVIIGVKRGYSYGEKWNAFNKVTKYEIGNISEGFKMLEKGRIQGFIGYEDSWDYVLKQKGWELKFKKTPTIDSNLEYVVSMKGIEKNNKLLEVYDEGKRKLIESGRLEELKYKWFGLIKTTTNEDHKP